MEKEYIGKIVATHGIKGEVKIISDFPFKDKVFVVGKTLNIDGIDYIIRSYRHHKIYEMVTLNDFKDISEVEFLMHKKVYINKDSLSLNDGEILDSDLLKYQVKYEKAKELGQVIDIFLASPTNKIVKFSLGKRTGAFPLNNKNISISKKEHLIYLKEGEVIFDEN